MDLDIPFFKKAPVLSNPLSERIVPAAVLYSWKRAANPLEVVEMTAASQSLHSTVRRHVPHLR